MQLLNALSCITALALIFITIAIIIKLISDFSNDDDSSLSRTLILFIVFISTIFSSVVLTCKYLL